MAANRTIIVAVIVLALTGAGGLLMLRGGSSSRTTTQPPDSRWARWLAMSPEEQRQLLTTYRTVMEQPDSAAVLAHARAFARLTPEQRERHRALHALQEDVLRKQPAANRAQLRAMSPRARAFSIFQILEAERPEAYTRLTPGGSR